MRYLKVVCANEADVVPDVIKWNSWDGEHLRSVHSAYNIPLNLYCRSGLGLFIDKINIPFFPIRIKLIVFTVQATENKQISFSLIPFLFLCKNSIEIIPIEKKKTLVRVTYEYEGNFFSSILFPLLKKMTIKWNAQVWKEDLPLKLRRQKALEYGFVDFIGLPNTIEERLDKSINYKVILPVPRLNSVIEDSHKFNEL
jgi:hypothetical protein